MELYVRIVDKVHHTNPDKSAQLLKRGDVVVIRPDGWPWSKAESESDEHRIVSVPDSAPIELDFLVADTLDLVRGKLRRRTSRLNLIHDSLSQTEKDKFDPGIGLKETLTISNARLLAISEAKPDPALSLRTLDIGGALETGILDIR